MKTERNRAFRHENRCTLLEASRNSLQLSDMFWHLYSQTEAKQGKGKKKRVTTKEVINGLWGNGDDRKNKLTAAGYNAEDVQNKVNELLNVNK